jgi:hypothetical protein
MITKFDCGDEKYLEKPHQATPTEKNEARVANVCGVQPIECIERKKCIFYDGHRRKCIISWRKKCDAIYRKGVHQVFACV